MTKYIEQFWRGAKPEDVLRNPPMVARFRGTDGGDWMVAALFGYRHGDYCWLADELLGIWAADCEVYDEPEWHKNKPEPGEGYRLLEKFPEPEGLVDGDEFLAMNGQWSAVLYGGEIPQHFAVWYRRKVEPAAVVEAKAEPIMAEFEVAAPANSKIGECVMHCVGDEEALGAAIVDPGEGFRLIDASEETPTAGDEFYSLQENCWKPRKDHNAPFNMLGCYRRKEEPVKQFVRRRKAEKLVEDAVHPIDLKDKWLFNGTPIEDRSYAVLNEHGHYLQWVEGFAPEFKEGFMHAFTPGLLLRMGARYLQNIRLRAVEPVDVDKLKQATQLTMEGCYELPRSAFIEVGDRYFDEDGNVCEAYTSVGMLVSNASRQHFRPILSFNEKRGWEFKGQKLDHVAYAVVNADGKFLQSNDEHGTGFTDRVRQTWTPSGLAKVHLPLLANCKLVPVQPVFADPVIEKVDLSQPTYEPGKVYEHNGRKFRLAVRGEEGYAVFGSNIGLPDALQGVARRLISVRADGFKPYQLGTGLHFQYAFVEIDEPKPFEPKAVEQAPTYEVGKVYECNGRKFRLATKEDVGRFCYCGQQSLEMAVQHNRVRLLLEHKQVSLHYYVGDGKEHWKWAFIEITEPQPEQEQEPQKVRLGGKEYWVLSRFQPVTKNGHEPREHVVLQEVVWTNAEFKFAFADSLDDAEEEPKPQQPEYVPFEWQDRHLLKNRYIRRKDDPDREVLILEINHWWDGTVEVRCREKAIRIDELFRDYVFDDGTPCGKRVEQ